MILNRLSISLPWARKFRSHFLAALCFLACGQSAHASAILFLTNSTTLVAGDVQTKATMEGMGHVVTVKVGLSSVTADTAGQALVVVSASIASTDVAAKFRNVLKPVIVMETGIFDDMNLTGTVSGTDFGTTATQTQLVIQTAGHQLAAGLTGTVTVLTTAKSTNFGKPGTGAIKVANQVGDATKLSIFAYDVGAAMVGLNAPGRRVGLFAADDGMAVLTAQGISLFQAAVSWSLGIVPPTISTQPANAAVTSPATATFSVVAAGTSPTYQWRKGGVNITGATSASYTTPATAAADNGALFSVVVTNSAGTVTSANATLTVNVVPTITTQPANATVVAPATATFNVVAAGTAPLTYQWRKGGVNITGATSASYTTPATAAADNASQFSVVVTNAVGTATSGNATLTVSVAPTITSQPANATVVAPATATFSVVAAGTAPLAFQWRRGGVNISGATSSSYTTPATATADNGALFSVVVSNGSGSVTSANASLTVNVVPTITTQPANATVIAPATATFSVVTAGTAPFTYQWRKGGVDISGAASASYTTPPTAPADNGSVFTVVVANSAGNVTSGNATLTVNSLPVISVQPAAVSVVVGQSAGFSITATGNPTPTYQWKRNGANISGAIASSYSVPVTVQADNGASFSVAVTNSVGTVNSSGAILTIGPRPTTQTVNLSGELFDNANNPIGAGTAVQRDVTVNLYSALTGGTSLYTETFLAANSQPVSVKDGLFTVQLGNGTTLQTLQNVVSANANLYAEFQIGTPGAQELIQPRIAITAPLAAGTPRTVQGTVAPTSAEPVGTYYQNTTDNSLWVRMASAWFRISP